MGCPQFAFSAFGRGCHRQSCRCFMRALRHWPVIVLLLQRCTYQGYVGVRFAAISFMPLKLLRLVQTVGLSTLCLLMFVGYFQLAFFLDELHPMHPRPEDLRYPHTPFILIPTILQ